MSNVECASLCLKTSVLNAGGGTNSAGISNSAFSNFTWTNIDLRTVLGDMYYKYDLFNLCLTTASTDFNPTAPANGTYLNGALDNALVTIYISGLPWKNQTYNQPTNHNGIQVPIATFNFPTAIGTYSSQNYNNPKFVTFAKSQDTCNINIQYRRIYDDLEAISPTVGLPQVIFLFSIYGIPKDQGNDNGSRIIV